MKRINILSFIVVLGLLFVGNSCTDDWEEMNVDPNNPDKVPATNILANSIRYSGDYFFDDWQGMNNFLSYSGHVTKIQYIDEALYDYRGGVVNTAWTDYYITLSDLQKMKMIAEEEEKVKTQAVAETYSVFLWQMATDQWKAIPYFEALKAEENENTPAYDSQEAIYYDLLARLEAANDMFNAPENPANPENLGEGDILFGGDFSKWQKFCNSLHLRVANRMSEVAPADAKAEIEKILGDPGKYPVMESNDDNAFLYWPGAAPYKEPWAENLETRDDHGMAKTLVDTLRNLNDPRLPIYAKPVEGAATEYVGVVEGAVKGSISTDTISRIGSYYRENPAGFTPYMRYAEVLFIQAEAAQKGWNVGMSAQDAYEDGIEASMNEHGITDVDDYLTHPSVAWGGDNLTKIRKQKWIAMFKQGQELWAEQRRTDFPPMEDAPGSIYGPENHNRQPFRYPYPDDEKNLNSEEWSKVSGGIVDDFWGQQMWWDTRTGVE